MALAVDVSKYLDGCEAIRIFAYAFSIMEAKNLEATRPWFMT
jgi:hypothetical protein